ncbi:MAG: hypothetical protein JSS75_02570 [Bacteroidetes bacterium]|nr:hypothetical protein [Bacteroidota bacterium]
MNTRRLFVYVFGSFLAIVIIVFTAQASEAQDSSASVKSLYGVMIGDPLGISMKFHLNSMHSVIVDFGPDYFGSPRLQVDYLWHFDTFRSTTVKSYLGPGLAVAFAKGSNMFYSHEPKTEIFKDIEDKHFGVGGRAIFGLDYLPNASGIEYFVELGPMVAMTKIFDLDVDGAIGARVHL